ncbi:MAG: acyloxyacyl hydrolase [Rickettsiales bacterium]|jgi:hypothetical protein|nr:acyloxyacyl hydrolase [Rickettsiales bacterium]
MKKLLFLISALFVSAGPAIAGDPIFGGDQNQISLTWGRSTGGGPLSQLIIPNWRFEGFEYFELSYGQPSEFFRLPARLNVHAGYLADHRDRPVREKSHLLAGISWDAVLLRYCGFYFGMGIGAFIKEFADEQQDSQFNFGEKAFIGYRFDGGYNAEFSTRHFSNGDLTPGNGSYNFAGITFAVSF